MKRWRGIGRSWIIGVLALTWGTLAAVPARAATFTVTKTADTADGTCDGDCSLREAVIAANDAPGPDTIVVPAGHYLLTRTGPQDEVGSLTGDLDLFSVGITIVGAGVGKTVIDAGGMGGIRERVFQVGAFDTIEEPSATMRNLTITGGWAVASAPYNEVTGGGIQLDVGSLTVERVAVHDNYAAQSGAGVQAEDDSTVAITDSEITENETTFLGQGAGLLFDGADATIDRTLIHDNHAMDYGGGIAYTFAAGTLQVRNSTISGNTAPNGGGGILLGAPGATIDLSNVTVTANVADVDANDSGDGGGIANFGGTIRLRNTILAGNVDASPSSTKYPDCQGVVTSLGHNLIGRNDGCTFAATTGDQVGTPGGPIDPGLLPLADNGGPTRTHALVPGSPAVNAGGADCEATDQRGAPRTGDCDIGAYELAFCKGAVANRIGTEGKDTLAGTTGPDGFLAFGGNDTVRGLGGKDTACLGPGKDLGAGGGGRDRLFGEGGKDRLKGQGGNDRLVGGPGKDTCVGGPGKRDRAPCEVKKSVP
jgi:CSLREA domain-containing protein